MKQSTFFALILCLLATSHLAMGRRQDQYDEEARALEKQQSSNEKKYEMPSPGQAAKRFVGGVKQVTVDSATGLVSGAVDGTKEDAPVIGTIEGTRQGTSAVLDNTVKGAVKVATLGYGEVDHYEVEEPRHGTDDTQKIKIKF